MHNSNKEHLLYNLSTIKYAFPTVCETALGQLDHYFSTVGNGIGYDPERGLIDEDFHSGEKFFLAENHQFDFDYIHARREKKVNVTKNHFDNLKNVFGDSIPVEIVSLFNDEIKQLSEPFVVADESYYFNSTAMANEMIDFITKQHELDRHTRLQIRTPYVLDDEYSIICKIKPGDHQNTVELALAMAKAWIIVLEYYIEHEWYFTEEEVEKNDAYWNSLKYINTYINDFNRIISTLENHNV